MNVKEVSMTQEHEQPSPDDLEVEQQGMEEASQGSFNPADEVMDRPNLPTLGPDLQQQPTSFDDDVELEAELLFGACPLFDGLSAEEVREVVRPAEKLHLQAGELLFEQGQEAYAMYLIQSGEVQVLAADAETKSDSSWTFRSILNKVHLGKGFLPWLT